MEACHRIHDTANDADNEYQLSHGYPYVLAGLNILLNCDDRGQHFC